MFPVVFDDFRTYANRLDGQTLVTRSRGQHFTVRVTPEGLEYTPGSTGKRRKQAWHFAERFLDTYNEKRSMHPVDYRDISINASYFLAVLGGYLSSLQSASQPT